MARDLYRDEPIFRAVVDECAERLRSPLGFDLRAVIYPREGGAADAAEQLTQTRIAQPALFVIEYALAALWRSWGLEPRAFLGGVEERADVGRAGRHGPGAEQRSEEAVSPVGPHSFPSA